MIKFLILYIFLIQNLCYSNSFPSFGLEINNFQEGSILFEIFKENKPSKFYLMEFNGTKIPDSSNPSSNLNFKLVLKDLYNFCQNPSKLLGFLPSNSLKI